MTEPRLRPSLSVVPDPYDVCGPLPGPGVTVLEASAGTGKTFTIAALAARYVADGFPLSRLLAVTFTRMATGELRDRVRARLVSAEDGLARLLDAGEPLPEDDTVLALLAAGPEGEVRTRRQRLAGALAMFDEATITTTHGFCQLVLAGLGVAGDVPGGASLMEDPGDLIEEVVDDLFVRRALLHGPLPFTRAEALSLARAAVANPDTELVPEAGDTPRGLRRRFAEGARREVVKRLADANLLTYDDLLVRLRDTLQDPLQGEVACARLAGRYGVVLVDEFQDTDPVQWDIVRTAFGTGSAALVLIGDPKQAVYAFRGADVHAYLDAAKRAGARFTLSENWRSDADLLRAFDALMLPLNLGDPAISYRQVTATAAHRQPGLEGAPGGTAMRVRILHAAEHPDLPRTASQKLIAKGAAAAFVASDVASEIAGLLRSGAELVTWSESGEERSRRGVEPGDLAVLVRINRHASLVAEALKGAGVPAVVAGADNVFGAPAAAHWLCLLEALEQPAHPGKAVAVALSPFFGRRAHAIARAVDAGTGLAGADGDAAIAEWEKVHSRLHQWAEVLKRRGVATLFRTVSSDERLPARLLRAEGGERELTDLAHIGQLLHREAAESQLGLPALRAWLARRIAETATESSDAEERSRRLDSDADAVQVLTVHRAKGLEFPVVYCPYFWDPGFRRDSADPVVFHDPGQAMRKLDVGDTRSDRARSASYKAHYQLAFDEDRGEDLRLLYVALTRARHSVVLWWARTSSGQGSPLDRLVVARDEVGNVPPQGTRQLREPEMEEALRHLGEKAPGCVSVERCGAPSSEPWDGGGRQDRYGLEAASFDRSLDLNWRRTSYSAITASVHAPVVGSEPEDPGTTDEPAVPALVFPGPASPSVPAAAVETAAPPTPTVPSVPAGSPVPAGPSVPPVPAEPSLLAELPRGTEVGTIVHSVLEDTDFAAPDLRQEVRRVLAAAPPWSLAVIGDPAVLVEGITAALGTPLGPLAGDAALRDVGRQDRMDELGFELPLAGGDRPSGEVEIKEVAALLSEWLDPSGPLQGYPARLAAARLATGLRGYLTGSLDLVFRRPVGGRDRFFVADYKTNWLGPEGESLTTWHYRPESLDAEMQHVHYPLQAILYSVALHRYLRWRLAGYEPDANLGGVLYLFIRGMVGPSTPVIGGERCGVFAWRPPSGLVVALSDLFDGRENSLTGESGAVVT